MERVPCENDFLICPNNHTVRRINFQKHLVKCLKNKDDYKHLYPISNLNKPLKEYKHVEDWEIVPKEKGKYTSIVESEESWDDCIEEFYDAEKESEKKFVIRHPVGETKAGCKAYRKAERERLAALGENKK